MAKTKDDKNPAPREPVPTLTDLEVKHSRLHRQAIFLAQQLQQVEQEMTRTLQAIGQFRPGVESDSKEG